MATGLHYIAIALFLTNIATGIILLGINIYLNYKNKKNEREF